MNKKIDSLKSSIKDDIVVKLYPFEVFVYNKVTHRIELSDRSDNRQLLTIAEVYDTILGRKDLNGVAFSLISFSAKVVNWKVQKLSKEIVFKIDIAPNGASILPFLRSIGTPELNWGKIELINHIGYYNIGGRCYPVDRESLELASQLFAKLDHAGNLSVNEALNLFSSRNTNRLIEFSKQTIDMHAILNFSAFKINSALFVRDLYNYQQDGVSWLLYCVINRIGGILADDMGLGKTAQVIALIAIILERKLLSNILIVVPSTLLENWRREFAFFTPEIIPFIHHGSGRIGSPTLLKKCPLVITSYSMIINDQYLFNKIEWGVTILDEASLIKNPESERRIALNSLPSLVKIAMTGTPVENSLIDLWSIVDYVYPGYFGDKAIFTETFVSKDIEQSLDSGALSKLRDDVSFIMLRRKKEDVLESLPERIDIHQALTMHAGEAILYDQRRSEILNETNAGSGTNALKLIMDLRMYTTHPLLRTPRELHLASLSALKKQSYKFKRLLELVFEIAVRKEKVLIFTEYLHMIDTIKRVIESEYNIVVLTVDGRVAIADRQTNIDSFSYNEGFAVMVLNPKTAGMGLNITAANHVIHYTRQWNPALEQQASARSYRNGQKKGVNIYYLYYADTIEEVIDQRLRSKVLLSGEVITETDAVNMHDYLDALSKSPIYNKI